MAAVLEALLDRGWLDRMGTAAGRRVTAAEREMLLALGFLHDMGKCNLGFWRRQDPANRPVGHTSIVLALGFDGVAHHRLDLLWTLADRSGESVCRAMLSHHGRPVVTPGESGIVQFWQQSPGYNPMDELVTVLGKV